MLKVWSYWEGPRWAYVDRCIASMREVCTGDVEYSLVTPDTLSDHLPAGILHGDWTKIEEPAIRTDCVRAALLRTHGGLWVDADTIGLRSPENLDLRADLVYCTWDRLPFRVLNGYIYLAPGSAAGELWLDEVNRRVAQQMTGWLELGEHILSPLVRTVPSLRIPRKTVLPVDVDSNVRLFFEESNPEDYIGDDTVLFGLNHSWMVSKKLAEMSKSEDEMAESPLLIHRLLSMCPRLASEACHA